MHLKSRMLAFAFALAVSAAAEEWRFEVAADAPKVVSCRVDAKWTELMATHDLVAVGEDGNEVAVPWVLDTSGRCPELVWLAAGRQRFALRGRAVGASLPETDLIAETVGDVITLKNSFFSLQHPVKGKGGFPEMIRFVKSGAADDGLFFMDQFVRKGATGGLDIRPVRNDGGATARLVFRSPLRAVVEVHAKIADIDVVYRYVYSAWSPLVRVDLQCRQDAGKSCAETWTVGMGWPREAPRYSAYLTKAGAAPQPFQEKGKPSRAFSDHWVAGGETLPRLGDAAEVGGERAARHARGLQPPAGERRLLDEERRCPWRAGADRPDLIVFADDHFARGGLFALERLGLRVPEDIRVVSHSNTGNAPFYPKPLTRFEHNPFDEAKKMVQMILLYFRTRRPPCTVLCNIRYVRGETF